MNLQSMNMWSHWSTRWLLTQTLFIFLINRFNEFDHNLFDIRQIESNSMDPQHKLLLECSYKVFENAGIPMEEISGSKTGVFIGE